MGLDTSHDAWHGAYSSFNRFRTRLAELAGFPPLEEMEGFGDGHYNPGNPIGQRKWGRTPGDFRLIPLLSHSDCDGEIDVNDCVRIADALEEIASKLPDDTSADGWVRSKALQFAAGCRAAVAAAEPIDFH